MTQPTPHVRFARDLLSKADPVRFRGEWSPDEPEGWETFTLQVHGQEAADGADLTVGDLLRLVRGLVESGEIDGEVVVVRQDAVGDSVIHMAGNPMADAADNLKTGTYLVVPVAEQGDD